MFVIIEKNESSVPSDKDITKAMTDSGGTVDSIEDENTSKKGTFTGEVNHTVFEQTLKRVTGKRGVPWEFEWGDALAESADALVESQATPYTVNIALPDATVNDLLAENFIMYGFKAVQATQGAVGHKSGSRLTSFPRVSA